MINQSLLNPKSIVIVGGSNDIKKPGGKILKNIIDGSFKGELFVVNQKESSVQGIACQSSVIELGKIDLAILCVPARFCPEIVRTLADKKETRAFIILSAGFAEAGDEGKRLETEIVEIVNSVNGCLIGPNCIGVLNANYNGVFTSPTPSLDPKGCDLISSSGSTAVFIMEAGIPLGLKFANVFSVGNSAQIGVEEVMEYMDLNHDPTKHSDIKLLYLESVSDPGKLLRHASSLIKKGVRIAAIKAGSTEAGSRAAVSHTGALTSSDMVVRALFKKAGIVYCSSREELLSVACVFNYKELKGKNIAVITHAGGSAVMLTDSLSSGGLLVPAIEGPDADKLLSFLHPGSSVSNPIDFLATGSAEQLGIIIDYCEQKFDQIDAMVVVFGSPGLFDVANVYAVLSEKLEVCSKPIFPVLPSVINARREIQGFLETGHINFPDEVVLGRALVAIYNTPGPQTLDEPEHIVDFKRIRKIIDSASEGFLSPEEVAGLLDGAGIPRVDEHTITKRSEIEDLKETIVFPVVMKVVGPVHKTDVGGVILNVHSIRGMKRTFQQLMQIDQATAVLVQPMINGRELFVGVQRESNFGHIILCGLGGIFIEVLNDFSSCLSPVGKSESIDMIKHLKAYGVIRGLRGKEGVNEEIFSEIIQRISALVDAAPEIAEMDINPLMGSMKNITAVDTRIRIEK
ncbi:MAG: CoA-binding protein [Gammaproteobacteria bacterium]|nr:MAG: CoA-binding protein [Gammaproteobacteria bacterium]